MLNTAKDNIRMALIHRIELKKILHFHVEIAEFVLGLLKQSIVLS